MPTKARFIAVWIAFACFLASGAIAISLALSVYTYTWILFLAMGKMVVDAVITIAAVELWYRSRKEPLKKEG